VSSPGAGSVFTAILPLAHRAELTNDAGAS
jgi:hypothetical protein